MPTWGDSQRYSIDVSDTTWGLRRGLRADAGAKRSIRTPADKHRFVARGQVGWIETNDFDKVPPICASSPAVDRSIPGEYKDISPRGDDGSRPGASKMLGPPRWSINTT